MRTSGSGVGEWMGVGGIVGEGTVVAVFMIAWVAGIALVFEHADKAMINSIKACWRIRRLGLLMQVL